MADEITTETETPTNSVGAETTSSVHLDLGGFANAEVLSSDPNAVVNPLAHENDVTFNVKYGKDYKGDKLMPEGNVVVSKESAAHFESLGIGKIVK